MGINLIKLFQCLSVLIKTRTEPSSDWFLILKTIILTLIKNPDSIFNRTTTTAQKNFLTDYLPRPVIVNSPDGITFFARPHYEDLARFLFAKIVAKWEPISQLRPKPGETFVDVGSNIGYYTLRLAKAVGQKGKVISIEPDPDSYEILTKNCKLNNLKTIELHNLAIGDHNGSVKLFRAETHSGQSSLDSNLETSKNSVSVNLSTLDELLEKLSIIDWMKIDVEGSELNVLHGSQKTLLKTKKILIEIHEPQLRKQNQKPEQIINILKNSGFKITMFNEYWDKDNSPNQTLKSDYIFGERL